jgi:hypothetical protein
LITVVGLEALLAQGREEQLRQRVALFISNRVDAEASRVLEDRVLAGASAQSEAMSDLLRRIDSTMYGAVGWHAVVSWRSPGASPDGMQ